MQFESEVYNNNTFYETEDELNDANQYIDNVECRTITETLSHGIIARQSFMRRSRPRQIIEKRSDIGSLLHFKVCSTGAQVATCTKLDFWDNYQSLSEKKLTVQKSV